MLFSSHTLEESEWHPQWQCSNSTGEHLSNIGIDGAKKSDPPARNLHSCFEMRYGYPIW